jgi:hypothetical protein
MVKRFGEMFQQPTTGHPVDRPKSGFTPVPSAGDRDGKRDGGRNR